MRIDFPFSAQFEFRDPGNNSREIRTQALYLYLLNCGVDVKDDIETYQVTSFRGEDNGEFWIVKVS